MSEIEKDSEEELIENTQESEVNDILSLIDKSISNQSEIIDLIESIYKSIAIITFVQTILVWKVFYGSRSVHYLTI